MSTTTEEVFVLLACVAAAVVTVLVGTLIEYLQRQRRPICRVRIRRRIELSVEAPVDEPTPAMLARIDAAVDSAMKEPSARDGRKLRLTNAKQSPAPSEQRRKAA